MRARLRHGLLVDAHDGLDVLAAGNLGHHAAKARVEVDGGGNHARAHGAMGVHHGHGRLVAGGFYRENQVACGSQRLLARSVTRASKDGPRADGGVRLRTLAQGLDVTRKRQFRAQDEGVVAGRVVARTTADLSKAQVVIGSPRRLVLLVHLERGGLGVEHVRVIAQARHQARGNALAAVPLLHGNVADLEVVAGHHAARKADDAAQVVRHPPAAARLREFLVEELLGPGRVRGAREGRGLQRRNGRQVVHRHGTQLQVPVGKGVVHARDLHACGRLETKPLALVLLGIREARVDGKHQRRVARVEGLRRGCESQALPRGVPQGLIQDVREARRLEARAVLLESVAGENEPGRILARGPRSHALVGLADGLGGEGAMGTVVIQQVDAGVDLSAHGVVRHGEKPAHAGLPGAPCRGVEHRDAVERLREAAREPLGGRYANAHAREAAGATTHEHAIEVCHGVAAVLKRREGRGDQLDVGLAAAHVVACGKDARGRAGLPGHHRARKHVGGRIDCKGEALGVGVARHSHLAPETWHYHEG